MNISKAAAGILAAACVAAGAGGAYVATRPAEPALAGEERAVPGPVEHSDAIVSDTPGSTDAPAAPAESPEPAATPPRPAAPKPHVAASPEPKRADRERPASAPAPEVNAPPAEAPRPAAPAAPVAFEPPRIVDNQASRVVEPPAPVFDELVVASDSVIGLEIETALTTEKARVEDAVVAHVTRDVKVGNRVAIPAGTRVNGEVTTVEKGGRLKDRARLGVRFTSVVLADGTRVPIQTETIYREGDSPTNASTAKIGGGAIGGAIIGGIIGGGKGAAIGTAIGAGAGSGAVMASGPRPATLPAGTPVTVRVQDPVVVTVER
jgi:hypothetical protein